MADTPTRTGGYFKDPKGCCWAFGRAALSTEIRQLSALPGLSGDPSGVGWLKAEDQQVPITAPMAISPQPSPPDPIRELDGNEIKV